MFDLSSLFIDMNSTASFEQLGGSCPKTPSCLTFQKKKNDIAVGHVNATVSRSR